MKSSADWSNVYDFPQGDDPKPDNGNLAQLFGDDSKSLNDLDFKYNPSNEKSMSKPQPQPRKPGTQQNPPLPSHQPVVFRDSLIAPLGENFLINFIKFGMRTCYISVVNGELLRFDDVVDGALLVTAPISSSVLQNSGETIVIYVDDTLFCNFVGDSEFFAKLLAVFSLQKTVEHMIICEGCGEGPVLEDFKILLNKVSFEFSNNEFISRSEKTENGRNAIQLYLTPENLQDPFVKHFLGKKAGTKLAIGINGVGAVLELRKLRPKKKKGYSSSSPVPSEMSETPSSSANDMRQRMEKVGAIKLFPMDELKKEPTPESQFEDTHEKLRRNSDISYQNQEESSLSPELEVIQKPTPAVRNPSNASITSFTLNSGSSLEKRVEALEKKLEELTTNQNLTGPTSSFEKDAFVMDIWAIIATSDKIPDAVKPEVKKLLLSTIR